MRERAEAPIDLLRERRIELGLPAQPAPFVSARLLLRRGALLGGACLLISFAVTAALSWKGQQQQQVGVKRSWWMTAGPNWRGRWQDGHAAGLHGPLVSDAEMSLLQLAFKAPPAESQP